MAKSSQDPTVSSPKDDHAQEENEWESSSTLHQRSTLSSSRNNNNNNNNTHTHVGRDGGLFSNLWKDSSATSYGLLSLTDDEGNTPSRDSPTQNQTLLHPYHRRSPSQVLRNFTIMTILFSANHGCVVACLALATARLGSVGAWQSGILYLTYTLSALLGATYIVKQLGARNSLVLGMTMYVSYVGCFVLALQETKKEGHAVVTAYVGAAVGGIAAGFMWTAQGAYFSLAAEQHQKATQEASMSSAWTSTGSTSLLAGIFAFWYLAEEVALRLVSTLLLELELASWQGVFGLYTTITILSALAMLGVDDFAASTIDITSGYPKEGNPNSSVWYKATAAIQLLIRDPKMKYMIGLNAAYGFASAFCNSYVNGEVVPVALDDPDSKWLGLLTAWGSAVAAMLSLIFGRQSSAQDHDEHDKKRAILILGAVCFGWVGGLFVLVPSADDWGWKSLLLVYSLMGIGRATFEGTLKATFADYFAYEKEGAFANIIAQNGLCGAIGYMLTFSLPCQTTSRYCVLYRGGSHQFVLWFELIVILSSIAGVLGFWRASKLRRQEEEKEQTHSIEMPSSSGPASSTLPQTVP